MTTRQATLLGTTLLLSCFAAVPVVANFDIISPGATVIAEPDDPITTMFRPDPSLNGNRFNYDIWNDALSNVVLDFGPSARELSSRPQAQIGTRMIRGHTSPLRLEGSRLTYEFLSDAYKDSLTDYRMDLQFLGGQYPLTSMNKDEQLAYWFNLHNVAVIEKIAQNYPLTKPSRIKVEVNGIDYPLHDAKFLTVNGVNLSLRDIREKIVYSNWDMREVMYGFYRGDIGSPLLPRWAYSRDSVWQLLGNNAEDFVNSLRGFSRRGDRLSVSALYEEARPYYFQDWEQNLTRHMLLYARPEVADEINKGQTIRIAPYEDTIGDLTAGRGNSALASNTDGTGAISQDVARLLQEVIIKKRNLRQRGLISRSGRGTVTIMDLNLGEDPAETSTSSDTEINTEAGIETGE